MPFNPVTKAKIVKDENGRYRPCVMCGRIFPPPDAAHIIDEKEWKEKKGNDAQINGLPLCKTCHTIFEDYLRGRLFDALKEFGTTGLPNCWAVSPKKQIKD